MSSDGGATFEAAPRYGASHRLAPNRCGESSCNLGDVMWGAPSIVGPLDVRLVGSEGREER